MNVLELFPDSPEGTFASAELLARLSEHVKEKLGVEIPPPVAAPDKFKLVRIHDLAVVEALMPTSSKMEEAFKTKNVSGFVVRANSLAELKTLVFEEVKGFTSDIALIRCAAEEFQEFMRPALQNDVEILIVQLIRGSKDDILDLLVRVVASGSPLALVETP